MCGKEVEVSGSIIKPIDNMNYLIIYKHIQSLSNSVLSYIGQENIRVFALFAAGFHDHGKKIPRRVWKLTIRKENHVCR